MFFYVLLVALLPQNVKADDLWLQNFWSGEYPMPILHVTKNTSVEGFESTGDLLKDIKTQKKVECVVPKGIYHPWANKEKKQTPQTDFDFWTIGRIQAFVVTKDMKADFFDLAKGDKAYDLRKGDTLKVKNYLAEGQCNVDLVRDMAVIPGSMSCPAEPEFKKSGSHPEFSRQFLQAGCAGKEKRSIWLTDFEALVKRHKTIQEGEILGYGVVGPAKGSAE